MRNAIAFEDVLAHQAAMSQLASAKFSINNPAAASMVSSAEGRQVLDYLIGCSLRKNQKFTVSSGGQTFTFQGDAGLAKGWKNHALDDKQKRWVSACMFARINNQGVNMSISLRGPHKALRVTQAEVNQFNKEEGVFYGNIFTGTAPVVGWSCRGQSQFEGEPEGNALSFRDCAEPGIRSGGDFVIPTNRCGWGYSGDCFPFEPGLAQACEQRITSGGNNNDPDEDGEDDDVPDNNGHASNTYYKRCHGGGGSNPLLNLLWQEVITVYVEAGPPSSVN